MLPNFIIIGAQKAGTTSLWRYLGQHPSVFVSQPKETDFFVAQLGWRHGIEWYESLFEPAGRTGAKAIGEASPNYAMHPVLPGVPERIARVIPAVRLIYLLRHPIERMVSAYVHALAGGRETLPIDRALLERDHYVATSRYAMQIERYLEHFDRSQLLVLTAEDLDRRRAETLDRVLSFLELPTGWRPENLDRRFHTTVVKRAPRRWWRGVGHVAIRARVPLRFAARPRIAMSPLASRPITPGELAVAPEIRARLEDLVRPDMVRLRGLLGSEFAAWGLLDQAR